MKSMLVCITAVLGVSAIPATALAGPQYVWERHTSNGDRFVYVTETPYPPPISTVTSSGVTFDSEVGAVCGTTRTQVTTSPYSATLGQDDHNALAGIAHCLKYGALRGNTIRIEVGYDGSASSKARMYERLGAVIETLKAKGVLTSQMVYSTELRPSWQTGQVSFHLAAPLSSTIRPLPVIEGFRYLGPIQ